MSRKAGKSIEDQKWWSWRERDTLEPVSMPCGIGGTFGLVVLTFTCCPFTSSSEGLTCERWWVCRALKVVEEVQPIPKRHMSPGRGNSNDLSESSQENVSTSTAQSRQALRLLLFFFFFFWPCCMACRILVPRPAIEPTSPVVETRSLNHWTAREVPGCSYFKIMTLIPSPEVVSVLGI